MLNVQIRWYKRLAAIENRIKRSVVGRREYMRRYKTARRYHNYGYGGNGLIIAKREAKRFSFVHQVIKSLM